MSKPQIIGASQSNFVWVTRIVTTEKQVDHELIPALPHTPVVDACHPLGKIPALRYGELRLGESRAICAYLDRAFAGPTLILRQCSPTPATSWLISTIICNVPAFARPCPRRCRHCSCRPRAERH